MDVQTNVASFRGMRFARVQPHADPNLRLIRPRLRNDSLLGRYRRPDRIFRTRKDEKESVSLAIDFLPASLLKGGAKKSSVLCEYSGVTITKVLQYTCRSLDVGEEERNCAHRQLWHRRNPHEVKKYGS